MRCRACSFSGAGRMQSAVRGRARYKHGQPGKGIDVLIYGPDINPRESAEEPS